MDIKQSPFHPDNDEAYQKWRDKKLSTYPRSIDDLFVEIDDPLAPSESEIKKIRDVIRLCNMAIYISDKDVAYDKQIPTTMMDRLGLKNIDHNPGAGDDGITAITPGGDENAIKSAVFDYAPYSNADLSWHTDGYYNPADRLIRSVALHCVHQAEEGGENDLLDPEIVYMLLRDDDPQYIRSLMDKNAMEIPARVVDGKIVRPPISGSVFSIDKTDGSLCTRYTHRNKNVVWKSTEGVSASGVALKAILTENKKYRFRIRLERGSGLLCNNVFHTRTGFLISKDGGPERFLYRIRYRDRIF